MAIRTEHPALPHLRRALDHLDAGRAEAMAHAERAMAERDSTPADRYPAPTAATSGTTDGH